MNHDELRELAEAYVLDALAPDDRRAFEAHLDTCAECSSDVRELQRVTDVLAMMVERREPPAQLRDRVLEEAKRSSQFLRAVSRPNLRPTEWLTVAASIAAIATAVYAASLRSHATLMEAELTRALARVSSVERELVQLREVAGAAERARLVLVASDVSQIELRGQPAAPKAHGRALWSATAGLLFTAVDLPALPRGKTYQLWVVAKSKPVGVGLVTPDAIGRASLTAALPPGTRPEQVALTIEPAGGVPAPTGAFFLVGAL